MKAVWNNTVIAESNDIVVVENNQYFPINAINTAFFTPSTRKTRCPWKGEASYYSVVVDGEINNDAAWYYAEPKVAASELKGRIAFWGGLDIDE